MKISPKGIFASLLIVLFLALSSAVLFADTVVTERTTESYPYFHTVENPIASIFYIVGDILALPFRLLGNLFAGAW